MNLPRPYTLQEIAALLECRFIGDPDHQILGFNEIHRVREGDIVFVDHPKYYDKALQSNATTVLINKEVEAPKGKGLLISENPFSDFNKLSTHFNPFTPSQSQIASTAQIGENTIIQPNCFIGNNVVIGDNCNIHSNVSIYDNTIIGNNVTIHANTVLGADAFYYKKRESGFEKLQSSGYVVIEDDVDLGASCTIDKGVSDITCIGAGSKLDNNVHVGHDTHIGTRCLIASQVGIAGCVNIGNEVTLWGQVGITSGISIGDKVVVLAQSGVSKSLEAGKTYFGYPADEARKKYKELASIKVLPHILDKIELQEED